MKRDAQGYSDALLGIFESIAPAASGALSSLAAGDRPAYHETLAPTVPLSDPELACRRMKQMLSLHGI